MNEPLYNPEPKEPDPLEAAAEFWRTATWMGGVFSLLLGLALGWALTDKHNRDARQAEVDAEHYRKLAEKCAVAFNRVAFQATYAGYLLIERAEYDRERFEYFDRLRGEPSVEWTAAVE